MGKVLGEFMWPPRDARDPAAPYSIYKKEKKTQKRIFSLLS